jgi:hypothetical protein
MSAVGYISKTEEIVKVSWSNLQHDGTAAFKLFERSPEPPPLCAKDLHGGQTQVLNVCRIKRINRHSAESDEGSAPQSISDTKHWPNWNGDLDKTNDCEDDWEVDNDSETELENGVRDA